MQYETIEVSPLSREVGAEVTGVDIAQGVSDAQFAEIHRAFVAHGVIFLRDQLINEDQHIAFAQRWGEINVNRFFEPVVSHPMIAEVRKEPDQKINVGG
ncbi:MAG: TauD/TfdA family dioxygenase, partial [Pseudomonadota bacterium]